MNDLHPIFLEALRPMIPAPAANTAELRMYRVTVGKPRVARLSFDALGVDSLAVAAQHEGLCEDGERVEVRAVPPDPYRQGEADRAQRYELDRMPGGGYLHD